LPSSLSAFALIRTARGLRSVILFVVTFTLIALCTSCQRSLSRPLNASGRSLFSDGTCGKSGSDAGLLHPGALPRCSFSR
jgi:hypothetical protein